MLDLAKSTLIDTRLYPVSSTVTSLEEGTVMMTVLENGVGVVKPCAGNSGEVFAGVSQFRHIIPSQSNATLSAKIPSSSPYTITLPKTPVGNSSVKVYINGVAATQDAASGTGHCVVSGTTITFHSADAGKTVSIVYRYTLSQIEASMLFGGEYLGPSIIPEANLSIITQGIVFTDQFVLADSWETTNAPIYLGASGKFTLASGGTAIDAVVVATPSVANGFLGIALKP